MQNLDWVAIGHLIKETIKFPHKTIGPVLGSPAAYSSVAAARVGLKTSIVTRIGKDMPRNLLKPISEVSVDTEGLKIKGKETTTNLLSYDASGNKTFRYLKKAAGILFNIEGSGGVLAKRMPTRTEVLRKLSR